ncbi:TIGR03435 family protein [Terriglobus roseus]|uniref:Soil-associated protein, TIGR03435 family n=1 Tax=Terriglobus roseus TaxID=392734 RepID=A0A1G7PS02_9BACT|nr:TIGR03435 family protein [Terriglobus roseus]SDF88409.1 soil-associated protein, TIGR03435 family [Terriglobus roseus]
MCLRLMRALLFVVFLVVPVAGFSLRAQEPVAAAQTRALPVWDVVSIKPHKPGDDDVSERFSPAIYSGRNVTFKMLISQAYGVKEWLIFGVPSWVGSQRWDIEAKVSEPDMKVMRKLSRDDRRAMLITLLRDHVGLVAHKESKVQPVFEMTALPEGVKFKAVPAPSSAESGEKPSQGSQMTVDDGLISGRGVTMTTLADTLSYRVERNIVDRTGLKSEYGYIIDLHWTPEERDKGNDNGSGTDAPPPFFEAVREQLGLKMVPGKAEVPTVVVEHIQQPDAN